MPSIECANLHKAELEPITEGLIARNLIAWLRFKSVNPITLSNVVPLDSPWEVDVLAVSERRYWSEFEIKLSVADYRNDFMKCVSRYQKASPLKHDLYSSSGGITYIGRIVPKPAKFTFVVPAGLLADVKIPEHCGLIEYHPEERLYHKMFRVVRKAPRLKKPTQLEVRHIMNLAGKACSKAYCRELSDLQS